MRKTAKDIDGNEVTIGDKVIIADVYFGRRRRGKLYCMYISGITPDSIYVSSDPPFNKDGYSEPVQQDQIVKYDWS